jgi:hypothetical protein
VRKEAMANEVLAAIAALAKEGDKE